MTTGDVPLTGTHQQQQIMRCLTLCSTIVGHASSDYCYIPALRPSGGAHPIGVWAHTRETTMVGCQSRSSGSAYQQSTSRKPKCYCRLGGGLPRAVRNVEAKRHSRRCVPSRLFPLSDMSVIPSAWNSRSGGGCNLPEVRSRMRLPNPRCAAMLVYNRPGEPRILTRSLSRRENTAYARRDKLSHSSAGTTVRGLLQARGEASSAQLEQLLLYVSAHTCHLSN